MTIEELIQAGYKAFEDSFKGAKSAYQKRIGSTRYFINVYHYDWSDFANHHPDSYECDLQFVLQDGEHLNLLFNCTKLTVVELETKVDFLFTTLNALPYED